MAFKEYQLDIIGFPKNVDDFQDYQFNIGVFPNVFFGFQGLPSKYKCFFPIFQRALVVGTSKTCTEEPRRALRIERPKSKRTMPFAQW